MGGRETNTVYFNDCEVPAEQLLGEQDRGWTQLMAGLNTERLILADPDRMLPKEASMVKLFVTEAAQRVALEGMQMMGGYGYSSEYDMERLVRATLVSTIYGGTSEIQRGIIAKTLGL
jgi:alkylation response protein AidB-like acyl-CoA dehydrogenase